MMAPSFLVSVVQVSSGIIMCGYFLDYDLNTEAYLSIAVDYLHPFITTVCPSSDGYVQQNNAP